jgi:hypothetical protein
VILAALLLGLVGTLAELILIGHYEDFRQQIPLAFLGAGLTSLVVHLIRPGRWTVRVLQALMMLIVVTGMLGVLFHYQGSREFQLEMDPALGGMDLVSKILHAKAPPTLAPGTMVQLGILGLAYAFMWRME